MSTLDTSRIIVSNITLPYLLRPADNVWRIYAMQSLYVYQLYLVPLSNGLSLLGWTDTLGNGHVSLISVDHSTLLWTRDFAGKFIRGVDVANGCADGSFGVFLWDGVGRIYISYMDSNGGQVWSTELVDVSPWPSKPTTFSIGDSKLSYGTKGLFGVYYHVHSDSGHEGDALYYVNATTGVQNSDGWGWGCSHSMSQLLQFHPVSKQPMAVCVSDCYPSTSISVFNGRYTVLPISGNCLGGAGAELGGMVPDNTSWHLIYAAQKDPVSSTVTPTMIEIAHSVLDSVTGQPGPVHWLTVSDGSTWKTDPSIARWVNGLFLVGWATEPLNGGGWWDPSLTSTKRHYLAIMNAAGNLIEGPFEVTQKVSWGRRDDPFRNKFDGSVIWAYGDPSSNILKFAHLTSKPLIPSNYATFNQSTCQVLMAPSKGMDPALIAEVVVPVLLIILGMIAASLYVFRKRLPSFWTRRTTTTSSQTNLVTNSNHSSSQIGLTPMDSHDRAQKVKRIKDLIKI